MSPGSPSRSASDARFRPQFLLLALYLVGSFFAIALALVFPELRRVLEEVPPGPEQQEIARMVAREAIRPNLLFAFLLALLLTSVGAYLEVLPGFRRR